ncbi:MAG: Asp-tRNA(Asn)/Glu-tRNA(Gln) amidotransferase subunit GatC [Candidatus Dadabacteria bacterium]|nr:Asp-tRNA(Asn)/Glu-tRNA(Gln) amidotransferase subunit GatC [Candidatus Dadabacteria bacterium]
MTKEKITKDEVENAAKLAMLRFDEEETERFRSYLAKILEYMENLNGLDTGGVEPASHALETKARLREDAAAEKSEGATAGAPESADGFFSVPRVVE